MILDFKNITFCTFVPYLSYHKANCISKFTKKKQRKTSRQPEPQQRRRRGCHLSINILSPLKSFWLWEFAIYISIDILFSNLLQTSALPTVMGYCVYMVAQKRPLANVSHEGSRRPYFANSVSIFNFSSPSDSAVKS